MPKEKFMAVFSAHVYTGKEHKISAKFKCPASKSPLPTLIDALILSLYFLTEVVSTNSLSYSAKLW